MAEMLLEVFPALTAEEQALFEELRLPAQKSWRSTQVGWLGMKVASIR